MKRLFCGSRNLLHTVHTCRLRKRTDFSDRYSGKSWSYRAPQFSPCMDCFHSSTNPWLCFKINNARTRVNMEPEHSFVMYITKDRWRSQKERPSKNKESFTKGKRALHWLVRMQIRDFKSLISWRESTLTVLKKEMKEKCINMERKATSEVKTAENAVRCGG